MAVTVLTAASSRLLALPEQLDDVNALRLVTQASAAVEAYCGRIFAQQTYRQTYRQTFPLVGELTLLLRETPVVAITQVLFGTTALVDNTDYALASAESGVVWIVGLSGSWAVSGITWITVDYTAGYQLPGQLTPPVATGPYLPDDISAATLAWAGAISDQQEQAETGTIRAKTLGLTGDRIEYAVTAQTDAQTIARPKMALDLLQPYRRCVLR